MHITPSITLHLIQDFILATQTKKNSVMCVVWLVIISFSLLSFLHCQLETKKEIILNWRAQSPAHIKAIQSLHTHTNKQNKHVWRSMTNQLNLAAILLSYIYYPPYITYSNIKNTDSCLFKNIKLFVLKEWPQSWTQTFLGQTSNDHSSWNNNQNELQFKM